LVWGGDLYCHHRCTGSNDGHRRVGVVIGWQS
jgi:hypothetical protein